MHTQVDVQSQFAEAAAGICYQNPEQVLPSYDAVRSVIVEMLDMDTANPSNCRGVRQLMAYPDFPAFFAHVRAYFHYDDLDTKHQVEADEPLFEVVFNALRADFAIGQHPACGLDAEVSGSTTEGAN